MGKRWNIVVNLYLLQFFLILFLANNRFFEAFKRFFLPHQIILIILIIIVFISFYVIKEMLELAVKENENEKKIIRLEESNKLITTLRSKHHDFMNHLQVILGLIQIKREEQAIKYIKSLSKELVQIEKLVALEIPEVAALISSKLASISYIDTTLEVNTTLASINISPEKLVSIIGNILDNAIYEAAFYDDKCLKIKILEDEINYVFEITNPGMIPPEIQKDIFKPGFTTKGDKGTGMGLYIVKNLVNEHKGQISINSQNGKTTVRVELPKAPSVNEKMKAV